jgi:hypothetical protein
MNYSNPPRGDSGPDQDDSRMAADLPRSPPVPDDLRTFLYTGTIQDVFICEDGTFHIPFTDKDLNVDDTISKLSEWKKEELRNGKGTIFSVQAALFMDLLLCKHKKHLHHSAFVRHLTDAQLRDLYNNTCNKLQKSARQTYNLEIKLWSYDHCRQCFVLVDAAFEDGESSNSVTYLAKRATDERKPSVIPVLVGEYYPRLVHHIQASRVTPYPSMKKLLSDSALRCFSYKTTAFFNLPKGYLLHFNSSAASSATPPRPEIQEADARGYLTVPQEPWNGIGHPILNATQAQMKIATSHARTQELNAGTQNTLATSLAPLTASQSVELQKTRAELEEIKKKQVEQEANKTKNLAECLQSTVDKANNMTENLKEHQQALKEFATPQVPRRPIPSAQKENNKTSIETPDRRRPASDSDSSPQEVYTDFPSAKTKRPRPTGPTGGFVFPGGDSFAHRATSGFQFGATPGGFRPDAMAAKQLFSPNATASSSSTARGSTTKRDQR